MIISASRRTDIPAFYADWFIKRIRAGYCLVPNPFRPEHAARVSLTPEDIDVIVFWTRHPRPLFHYLDELDQRGYRYYFQYTLLNNPPEIDPKTPALETALKTFRQLADRIGPEKVIWRYDPLVFSNITDVSFHRQAFQYIAHQLCGHTCRAVISLVDYYRKLNKRLAALAQAGIHIQPLDMQTLQTSPPEFIKQFEGLMCSMVQTASENGMDITSCAEEIDLQPYGIRPGKCIDDVLIKKVFGLEVSPQKDPSQRLACGCVASKDIGVYDTCLFGCQYCYATNSFERAGQNYERHDPEAAAM